MSQSANSYLNFIKSWPHWEKTIEEKRIRGKYCLKEQKVLQQILLSAWSRSRHTHTHTHNTHRDTHENDRKCIATMVNFLGSKNSHCPYTICVNKEEIVRYMHKKYRKDIQVREAWRSEGSLIPQKLTCANMNHFSKTPQAGIHPSFTAFFSLSQHISYFFFLTPFTAPFLISCWPESQFTAAVKPLDNVTG